MMQLTKEQTNVVNSQGKKILVLASAGSGKTTIIIQRIKELLARNVQAENILALTFANKAAQNIRNRILSDSGIHGEGVTVRTFHSFGSWFLRKYAEHAGLSPSYTVYDDDAMATLVKQVAPSLSTKEVRTAVHQMALHTTRDNIVTEHYLITQKFLNFLRRGIRFLPRLLVFLYLPTIGRGFLLCLCHHIINYSLRIFGGKGKKKQRHLPAT